jgi:hypothetical protein
LARTFTTFFPSTVLFSSGIHIHHFWFGIALLAVGGWLGISYNDKETDRLAAILYGAGGGLIVDEVGLLLTFGDYWTDLTYGFFVVFLAFIAVLILFYRYRHIIVTELAEFVSHRISLYAGVLLEAVAIAFILETSNFLVAAISGGLTIAAIIMIVTYLAWQFKKKPTRTAT